MADDNLPDDQLRDDQLRSDQALYERIWVAHRDKKIDIGVDLKRLNKPGGPMYRRSDNLLPWVALICLSIVGYRMVGWIGVLAVVASMAVLMATTINFAVMSRLRVRTMEYTLSGRQGFEELWAGGGLTLRMPGEPASEISGPDGDWRMFARQRLEKGDAETDPSA